MLEGDEEKGPRRATARVKIAVAPLGDMPVEKQERLLAEAFEASPRAWEAEILPTDEDLAPEGRVLEVLSEHLCQGWLEGYLLTGRHGLFNCYEAFIHIVDAMFNQHAK